MKITAQSHVDHNLDSQIIDFVSARYGDRDRFFVETVDLPGDLTAPCGLYGPIMGDAAVAEVQTAYALRGDRPGLTRSVRRPERPSRLLTVIAGPAGDEPCVLYTAFGGPCAPREPWDPSLDSAGRAESQEFWGQHALAWEGPALVNLTPHALELQGPDGTRRTLPPSGTVARVAVRTGDVRRLEGIPVPVAQPDVCGQVEGLPDPKPGLSYVVSALVGAASTRPDVLVPGTGPQDGAIREDGHIVAVTRLKQTVVDDGTPHAGDPCPRCGDRLLNCSPTGMGSAACDGCGTYW